MITTVENNMKEEHKSILLHLAESAGWNQHHKTFTRWVTREKNYFRIHSGYGFDQSYLEDIFEKGTDVIIINELDTDSVFISLRDDWTNHCKLIGNDKYGPQAVLGEYFMTCIKKEPKP